ncbi:molecular chaperone [Burkholderia cepacia]|uniref:Fimbrial chaperone protein n=1 Tax=Burkholderia cepacia GG4 TaxID=1009846 RepID=A0A9W3P7I7_BURCE|nr:fimbria/pilus periplasmic chaperone [Burkholderia cepacia]AFQ46486.1 putative fimbrial chaperone protein [Burkholderia cepacia GG4]
MQIQKHLSRCLPVILGMALALAAPWTKAGVVVTGTRVIYPAGDREVTVKLDNTGALPSLVQAWVDDGDMHSGPGKSQAPFILMPPVSRIDPGKGQTLRLVYTGEPLPQDRESLFWLNVLDVAPQRAAEEAVNSLQLAFRTRIKIFFRPNGLSADDAADAAKQLGWALTGARDGHARTLEATNRSPYHVTVLDVRIKHDGRAFQIDEGTTIAPGQSHAFRFDAPLPDVPQGTKFEYSTINDYGTDVKSDATLGGAIH